MNFKWWTASVGAACAALVFCSVTNAADAPAKDAKKPRVVILGFDGMEPTIVDSMLKSGELPNFDALRKDGVYERLRSTFPPQSPAAWSSFATCVQTGDHGIFDFLRRDPKRYIPDFGYGTTNKPRLAPDGSVMEPPKAVNYRRGETFWAAADRQGAKCTVLHIPFSFPPDHLQEGLELSGEGVPDIRGSVTTFFALSDAFTPEQLKARVSGGVRLPLEFKSDAATVNIPGYPDPQKPGAAIQVPLTVTVNRKATPSQSPFRVRAIPLPRMAGQSGSNGISMSHPSTQFTPSAISVCWRPGSTFESTCRRCNTLPSFRISRSRLLRRIPARSRTGRVSTKP